MPRSIAEFGSGLEPARGPGPAVPGHPRGRAPPAVRGRAVAPRPGARADQRLRAGRSRSTSPRSRSWRRPSTRTTRPPSRPSLGQGMFEPTITPGQQHAMAAAGDAARAGRGLGRHGRRRGGRRPAARCVRAARDAAPPPRHRRPGRADLRHPDRPGAAAAPAARRRGALARPSAQSRGIEGRDALWAHPDLLPSLPDLDDPHGFVDRDKQFAELLAGLDDVDTSVLDGAGRRARPASRRERPRQ